jgi:hypothetical protein
MRYKVIKVLKAERERDTRTDRDLIYKCTYIYFGTKPKNITPVKKEVVVHYY